MRLKKALDCVAIRPDVIKELLQTIVDAVALTFKLQAPGGCRNWWTFSRSRLTADRNRSGCDAESRSTRVRVKTLTSDKKAGFYQRREVGRFGHRQSIFLFDREQGQPTDSFSRSDPQLRLGSFGRSSCLHETVQEKGVSP